METCTVGAFQRFTHQLRDGALLLARQISQATVHDLVQVELRADHVMYIHHPTA